MNDRMHESIRSCARAAVVVGALTLGVVWGEAASAQFAPRKGVNIEAWQQWTSKSSFLAPTYDRRGFPDWTGRVDDAALRRLPQQGFDFVRVNVDASPLLWAKEETGDLIGRVVAATRRLQDLGLAVIVDLHLLPETDDRPEGLHDVLGTGGRPSTQFDRYLAVVSEMAARLSVLPVDRTALELINEPDQDWFSHLPATDRWPAQLAALHAAARKSAPELTLILSGARSSSVDGLIRLDPSPFRGDSRLFWTFHYYEPMSVTHSGQPWEETPARFLTRLPYPAQKAEGEAGNIRLKAARSAIDQAIADPARRRELIAGTERALRDYRVSGAGPAAIEADFARVADWARNAGIPASRVLLGEFGVFQDGADPSARLSVIAATRAAAEKFGFVWAIYTAGLTRPRHSFGVMSDDALTVEPEVKAALGLKGR